MQKEEHDDFLPVNVLAVYQVFEASQSPGEKKEKNHKHALDPVAINKNGLQREEHTVSIFAGSNGCMGGQDPKILYVSSSVGCETGNSASISSINW